MISLTIFIIFSSSINSTTSVPVNPWTHWGVTIVSTESTLSSYGPSVAIDSQDNVHVVWSDPTDFEGSGTDNDIHYKNWNRTTNLWSPTEVVSTESTSVSDRPNLAIDGDNNIHVTWPDLTNYSNAGADWDIFYKFKNTTLNTWNTTKVLSTDSNALSLDPKIAIDSKNNIYIAWYEETVNLAGSGSDPDIFYKKYSRISKTWSANILVSTESSGLSSEVDLVADKFDNIHFVWSDYTNYLSSGTDKDIFYKYLIVPSDTLSSTEVVSTESTSPSAFANLVYDTDKIHLTWSDGTDYLSSGADFDILYKYISMNTALWSTAEVVSTQSTSTSSRPSMGVDSQGIVHIAWHDTTDYLEALTDNDIFYKFQNGTGNPWTPTEVVSAESSQSSDLPSLALDSFDNIHIVWDDGEILGGSGIDNDIFYKVSTNLAAIPSTVTETQMVTSTQFDTITQIQPTTNIEVVTTTQPITEISVITTNEERLITTTVLETVSLGIVPMFVGVIFWTRFRNKFK